jgi:site-specific recombinase XerD
MTTEVQMKGCRALKSKEVKLISNSFYGTYERRNRALFLLGCKTGLRISELLSLKIKDVCQNGRIKTEIEIRRANTKGRKSSRIIYLHNPMAGAALEDWLKDLQDSGCRDENAYVFQSRKGRNQPISRRQASRILEQAARDNGLDGKIATHSMRKTYAEDMFRALDNNLVDLQYALGHASINSTISYVSPSAERVKAASQSI